MKRATKRNGKRNRSNRKMRGGLKKSDWLITHMSQVFADKFTDSNIEAEVHRMEYKLNSFTQLFDGFCKSYLMYKFQFSFDSNPVHFINDMRLFMNEKTTSTIRDKLFEKYKGPLLFVFEEGYLTLLTEEFDKLSEEQKNEYKGEDDIEKLINFGMHMNAKKIAEYRTQRENAKYDVFGKENGTLFDPVDPDKIKVPLTVGPPSNVFDDPPSPSRRTPGKLQGKKKGDDSWWWRAIGDAGGELPPNRTSGGRKRTEKQRKFQRKTRKTFR